MTPSDIVRLMKEKAAGVQAFVSDVADFDAVARYVTELTIKRGGQTLAATGLAPAAYDTFKAACGAAGLTLLGPPFRPHAHHIHTALTAVDGGIAETGTLVLDSAAEDVRLVTMLADTHVAILPVSRIKPDAAAFAATLDARLKTGKPAYHAFITGASRTADIERVLAIGVHGPRELHILIMADRIMEDRHA